MKITVQCSDCELQELDYFFEFELTDENTIFPVECTNGHKNAIILPQQKFELLFEMGLRALEDGYTREAAFNFATALERFHEYCVKVMSNVTECQDSGAFFDAEEFNSEFQKTWKEMSRQSERQYGAFMILYLVAFKRKPTLIPSDCISFRNDVTHKGIFPKEEAVIKYGKFVFDYISEKYMELNRQFPKGIAAINKIDTDNFITSFNGGTLLHWKETAAFAIMDDEFIHKTFEEARLSSKKLNMSRVKA
ncbi:hypothetical protein [Paenibacillus sp. IITD108]|uniref:hypothetical protein n=1 Tax=Paenibacillus sp. IITD108 TaxID=3116649 RepID=UPI002F424357